MSGACIIITKNNYYLLVNWQSWEKKFTKNYNLAHVVHEQEHVLNMLTKWTKTIVYSRYLGFQSNFSTNLEKLNVKAKISYFLIPNFGQHIFLLRICELLKFENLAIFLLVDFLNQTSLSLNSGISVKH